MNPQKKARALAALEGVGLTKDGEVTEAGQKLMDDLADRPDVYRKHHYKAWSEDRSTLGGFAKLLVAEGEGHSECSRCGVFVVLKKVGGLKFWVNGALTSKRPPCVVPVKPV